VSTKEYESGLKRMIQVRRSFSEKRSCYFGSFSYLENFPKRIGPRRYFVRFILRSRGILSCLGQIQEVRPLSVLDVRGDQIHITIASHTSYLLCLCFPKILSLDLEFYASPKGQAS
jgi:hypothetical protein